MNPSGPGLFPGFSSLIAVCISAIVIGSSKQLASSVLRVRILLFVRKS